MDQTPDFAVLLHESGQGLDGQELVVELAVKIVSRTFEEEGKTGRPCGALLAVGQQNQRFPPRSNENETR